MLRKIRENTLLTTVLIFFTIGSLFLIKDSIAVSTLSWMAIYFPEDFFQLNSREIYNFFKELRIPIPPVLGLAEIISLKLIGTTDIITHYFYKVTLIFVYLLSIYLANKSIYRLLFSAFISIVFLYATTRIHPGNPQVYDIALPFFFLMYIFFFEKAQIGRQLSKKTLLLSFFSGFFLSMAELSRPFVIYIIPLLLMLNYVKFQKQKANNYPYFFFITPVILLSGVWHLHLYLNLDQTISSNHSGFNLLRAWDIDLEALELLDEPNSPLAEDRWPNLNTYEHNENSKIIQKEVFNLWVTEPKNSFFNILERINYLLSAETSIYQYKPVSPFFSLYKFLVQITSSLLIIEFGKIMIRIFTTPRQWETFLYFITRSDFLIMIFTLYCMVMLSIGDSGEEARFLITILPLLATLPTSPSYKTL